MAGIYFNPFDGKFIALPQKIGKNDSPTFAGMEITGDLVVSGNTVSVSDLTIADKTVTVAFGSPSGSDSDGGGFIIGGANIEFLYNHSETAMTLNTDLLPSSNTAYDIGSTSLRWKDGWFSSSITASSFKTSSLSVSSNTLTTSTTAETVLISVSSTSFRSGKFIVQAVSESNSQVSEILVTHDNTSAVSTEYGIVFTGADILFNIRSDINDGNLRLLVTSTTSTTTTYNVTQTFMI
jgi:hypothetical protein